MPTSLLQRLRRRALPPVCWPASTQASWYAPPAGLSAAAPAQRVPDVTWREMVKTPEFYKLWLMLAFSSSAGLMIFGQAATVARVHNDDGAMKAIGVQGLTAPSNGPGGKSTGYEVGMRHFF